MKAKMLLLIVCGLLGAAFAKAQQTTRGIKVGYIDMEYILANVPEYQQASQELESKMQKWKAR